MSTLIVDELENLAGTRSTSSDNVIAGCAKMWLFFGVSGGTPSITNSYNVSSITDNGTGDFTYNFTSALTTSSYAAVGVGTAGGANYQIFLGNQSTITRSTSSFRAGFGYVSSVGGNLTNQDPLQGNVVIFA